MRAGATVLIAGCGDTGSRTEGAVSRQADASVVVPEKSGPTVVFLGDSLTSGYGIDEDQAFPARAGRRQCETRQHAGGTARPQGLEECASRCHGMHLRKVSL